MNRKFHSTLKVKLLMRSTAKQVSNLEGRAPCDLISENDTNTVRYIIEMRAGRSVVG
jgi:hypothetical protein